MNFSIRIAHCVNGCVRSLVLGLIIAAAPSVALAERFDPALGSAVDEALRPGVQAGATVAVRILDVDSGEVLLETPNAREAFIPASNMKLVTSAATLDLYGPEHQLSTLFEIHGGQLVVTGSGDPAFGDPSLAAARGETPMTPFDRLAQKLRDAGITRVPNGIEIVDAVFDDQLVHPLWHPANLLHWYGAPVAGLSFNDNCVDVTFKPTQAGQPAALELLPPAGGFEIRGEALTVLEQSEHAPQFAKLPGEPVFVIGGKVVRVDGPYSKPVEDPRRFVGEVTAAALKARGIDVSPSVRVVADSLPSRGSSTPEFRVSFDTPITEVLGRVNTNSQNMMAEALAKLNGLAYDRSQGVENPRGSWGSGHLAAADFLRRIGVDDTTLTAADGSGLARENRLSAELLTELLRHMLVAHEHGEHFLSSMAISGVRGSVRNRLAEGGMKGRIYAKTGTISGVSALSGYVFHDSGRVLAFSILHNGIEGSQSPYRDQQDAAVAAMWQWLGTLPPPESDAFQARPEQLRESLEVLEAVAP